MEISRDVVGTPRSAVADTCPTPRHSRAYPNTVLESLSPSMESKDFIVLYNKPLQLVVRAIQNDIKDH